MKAEIRHNWFYSQSVEEVWEFLTKAELIEKWLMPNDFKPKVGHEFTFTTNPLPSFGLDGVFYCKVLEIIPFEKLVYSWKGGASKGNLTLETIVEWSLKSQENGTELRLVHSGFSEESVSIFTAMFDGWNNNIQKMRNHLKSD